MFFQQIVIMLVADLYELPQTMFYNSCLDGKGLELQKP